MPKKKNAKKSVQQNSQSEQNLQNSTSIKQPISDASTNITAQLEQLNVTDSNSATETVVIGDAARSNPISQGANQNKTGPRQLFKFNKNNPVPQKENYQKPQVPRIFADPLHVQKSGLVPVT